MIKHKEASSKVILSLIRSKHISYAGNAPARIYGTLACSSGKRMKIGNRVFFSDRNEAVNAGFRPCAHCLRSEYEQWKLVNGQNFV